MGPANTSSYSLQDICNRLETGAAGTQRNFTEPSSGPADSADCTLNEVMEKAPAVTGEAAEPDDVATGTKYWGLTGGEWGLKTGTSTAVDTSSGNATADDIREGKIAWVDGKQVVGLAIIPSRYTKNNDGTVTDNRTGLVWLEDVDCINRQSWQAAMNEAKSLKTGQCNLTDGSEKNDWRLPTKEEWEMMVDTLFRGPALSNTSTLSRLY